MEVTFGAGSVYQLDGLWFVRVSVVVGRLYAREYGVWWWSGEVSCEPGRCEFVGREFDGGGVYPFDGLWIGRVVGVAMVCWYARVNGVWCVVAGKGGGARLTLCAHSGM